METNYPAGSDTASAPFNAPITKSHSCTFCGREIEGEIFEADEFGPEVFDPQDAVRDGDGLIHNKCILPQLYDSLTPEDRTEVVRLMHALQIISDVPDKVLEKFDRASLISTYLLQLKEQAEFNFFQLNTDPGPFCEETLVLVDKQAMCDAKVAIAGAISSAQLDLATAKANGDLDVFLDIKSDRLTFLQKTQSNLREAL